MVQYNRDCSCLCVSLFLYSLSLLSPHLSPVSLRFQPRLFLGGSFLFLLLSLLLLLFLALPELVPFGQVDLSRGHDTVVVGALKTNFLVNSSRTTRQGVYLQQRSLTVLEQARGQECYQRNLLFHK